MAQSPSEITGTSPSPFSPFTSYSSPLGSELATSDDAPDLGAFTNVFRELEAERNQQPRTITIHSGPQHQATLTPTSSILVSPSSESDRYQLGHPISISHSLSQSSYEPHLSVHTEDDESPLDSDDVSDTEAEGDGDGGLGRHHRQHERHLHRPTSITDFDPDVDVIDPPSRTDSGYVSEPIMGPSSSVLGPDGDDDQPSLGFLDSALSFLAAEAAKHAARRTAPKARAPASGALQIAKAASNASHPTTSSTSEHHNHSLAVWRHVVEPRRKRRRKKATKRSDHPGDPDAALSPGTGHSDHEDDAKSPGGENNDADDSSSSPDAASSSPRRFGRHQHAHALHTKSVPASPPRNRRERRRQQRALATAALDASTASALTGLSALANFPNAAATATSTALDLAAQDEDRPKLNHSKSTPTLRLNVSIPLDPRVLRLRALAHKLRMLFPDDAKHLSRILSSYSPEDGDFIDTRGPAPDPAGVDALVHVFVDHSNILFGLLTYIKRRVHPSALKRKHISHAALALILERGRPVTRRVLVASSPLYQPMETAEQLGYEVRVYARVPDTGEGADRVNHRRRKESADMGKGHGRGGSVDLKQGRGPSADVKQRHGKGHSADFTPGRSGKKSGSSNTNANTNGLPPPATASAFVRGHAPKVSSASNSTESEPAVSAGSTGAGTGQSGAPRGMLIVPRPGIKPVKQPAISQSLPVTTTLGTLQGANGSSSAQAQAQGQALPGGRVRYREQGVDELLQLKLHQALAEADPPPPGATIVLATGDGNVGEFNEEGFVGCVRTALKKGWRVELYAWEEGLSRAWMKEFGSEEEGGKFRIVGLERFAGDLLDA